MQRIRPLTKELDTLQASLASGAARLEECHAELATLDGRKVGLQADLSARNDEAAELKVRLRRAVWLLALPDRSSLCMLCMLCML